MLKLNTFGKEVMDWTRNLTPDWDIPSPFEIIFPYESKDTLRVMDSFYQKFYSDNRKRVLIFGINPGRFGAGITGIPFTDPIQLQDECGIENPYHKRPELSSEYVYEFIHGYGGTNIFYQDFYITSICPLGFLEQGKNCNYYDDKKLLESVEGKIIENIKDQISFGGYTEVSICLGIGKNYKYFEKLNERHKFFDRIIPLPHPRWVMQYRRKQKESFVTSFVETFKQSIQIVRK